MTNEPDNWSKVQRLAGPCLRPGGTALTQRALDICDLPTGARIADIGCGAGETLEYLARVGAYRLAGLDNSHPLLVEAASRLDSGRLIQGRAESLPFQNRSLDALFCECVLSLVADRTTALHEFARVLKKGGYLIVSDVCFQGCPGNGFLTRNTLLDLLSRHGFSLLLWEEHPRLLQEFAARLILAGERLPDLLGKCGQGPGAKTPDFSGSSYSLLVARASEASFMARCSTGDH